MTGASLPALNLYNLTKNLRRNRTTIIVRVLPKVNVDGLKDKLGGLGGLFGGNK